MISPDPPAWLDELAAAPRVRGALGELREAFESCGYLPHPRVEGALTAFLEALDRPDLCEPPARAFVDNFFSMHPDAARTLFYRSARRTLAPEQCRIIETVIMDGLELETWAVAPAAVAPESRAAVSRPFGEGDFTDVMARFFGREHVHPEREDALHALLAESRAALLAALDAAGVSGAERSSWLERFAERYEHPIREVIEAIRAGRAGGAHFWLGR